MQKVRYIIRFLHYYFTAWNKHAVHSPFVFNLVTKVINDKTTLPVFDVIEKKRKDLLKNETEINVTDYGTAFGGPKTYKRKISTITKHSAKPKKYAQLLFRIINFYKPETILELGTSFGISTMYEASGNRNAKVITLEGCMETAKVAEDNFNALGFQNIEIVKGDFNQTLPIALEKLPKADYVFFDGNHQKKPTLEYFELCLKKVHNKSIFIFDDINWSAEMCEAWDEIKNHPKVIVTVDLFFLGIVFFNPELTKQDFIIRF